MIKKLMLLISFCLIFALWCATTAQAGTLDFRVSGGDDDAEQDLGDNSMDLTSTDLEIIKDGTTNQIVGLRFTGINIAKGTTINSAYVEFEVDALPTGSADAANVVINGELATNAAAFTSTAGNLSGRSLTTAKTSWTIPAWAAVDAKSQSADLKAIIQEIVNQATWEPGNAIVLLIRDDASAPSVGTREAEAFNGEAAAAPLLHIDFEGDPVQLEFHNFWREAESADVLTPSMVTFDDDPCASGGEYIGAALGTPSSTTASPAPDSTASYIFTVPKAGTYQVIVRLKMAEDGVNDDSAYARIDGATLSSTAGLVGGWIKWNGISARVTGTDWAWVKIFNDGDGGADEKFTMAAGQYTLEIAHREDGLFFDGILITDDLSLNISTLPDALPACVEENILVNGGFEDGFVGNWGFDNNTSPERASHQIVGDAQDGYNALKITVFNPYGSSQAYRPAFRYGGLTFEEGKKYTWSVWLKSATDGLQVSMKAENSSGTGYVQQNKILTTDWVEYSVTIPTMTSTISPAVLSLWLGYQAGDIYVDHARFYEGDYVPPCPPKKVAVMTAENPDPADGTTGLKRQVMLSWEAGDSADRHYVYIGTNLQNVTNATVANPLGVLAGPNLPDASFNFTSGDYGTTYYWRVDEVNTTDAQTFTGAVWSFTTSPIAPILPQSSITVTASSQKDATQDPNKTIDGSGLNAQNQHSTIVTQMWLSAQINDANQMPKAWIQYNFDTVYKIPRMLIWNYNAAAILAGEGMKGVKIEYSSDGGQNWNVWTDVNELPKASGTNTYGPIIVDLGGVANGIAANAIRISALSNHSTSLKYYGLSEVKFYYLTPWPTNPGPADDAASVSYNKPKLAWKPGDCVVQHKVYFSADEMAVINGTAPYNTVDSNNWTAPELVLGTTYYWRVEEVNLAANPSVWSGQTWSFTVQDYRVVDDFESYGTSIPSNSWSVTSGTGASIGLINDPNMVRNGSKSMKLSYDNTSKDNKVVTSEVKKSIGFFDRNWTSGTTKYLVFWIYGDKTNPTTEKLYVKLNSTTYYQSDSWFIVANSKMASETWSKVVVPLRSDEPYTSDTTNFSSVANLNIGLFRDGETAGKGFIYIDDIRLYNTEP